MAATSSISKVSLFITCNHVEHSGKLFVTVQELNPRGQPTSLGTTEGHRGSSLIFQTPIVVDYLFELRQNMRAIIHEEGRTNAPLGHCSFQLAQVMTAQGLAKSFPLSHPIGATMLITAVDHSITREDLVTLAFAAEGFGEQGCCSAPCPFFVLYRVLPSGQRVALCQGDVRKGQCDPSWPPLPPIRLAEMMGRDTSEKTLDLCCFHRGTFGDSDLGHVLLSVNDLQEGAADNGLISRLALRRGNTGQTYGFLKVTKCSIQRSMTFVQLLASGWQVNMVTAIDFTASNGDPRDPKSLHHFNLANPNEYLRTIQAVGGIVLEYDSDQMVAGFGFGAELPDRRTSHFFHLNLQADPYVAGLEGLIAAYQHALGAVKFSGPTNFAPTIRSVLQGAHTAERDHIYTILLMITDGEINDIDETIDLLVEADDAALSIIIVGVGTDCDFAAMVQLDGDDAPLVSRRGRKSRRDLVQFVPMKDWVHRTTAQLAAEVLREIPMQVERWAVIKGLQPLSV